LWLFKCLSAVVFLFVLPHFSVVRLRTIKGVILVQSFLLAPVFRLSLLLPLVFNVISIVFFYCIGSVFGFLIMYVCIYLFTQVMMYMAA